MEEAKILEALKELRKNKERKFNQTVDLIINLKSFDAKKDSVNVFLELPFKIKDSKVAGFFETKSSLVDTILSKDFSKYKDLKLVKNLVKKYDFFIASAKLMPEIATTFGRYLGPVGKMPSPQLGILKTGEENEVKEIMGKIDQIIKVKSKEPSLKFPIGKQTMKDEEIVKNIVKAYNTIEASLPRKKENIRSVMIKFTMTKPKKL